MTIKECTEFQGGKLCVEIEFGDFYSANKVERFQREVLDTITEPERCKHV
jgi:hypothetical protein